MSLSRAQADRQIAYLLTLAKWADTPGTNQVLESVVSAVDLQDSLEPFLLDRTLPFAVVVPGPMTCDRQRPDRSLEARWVVKIVAQNVTDRFGQAAIVGANRSSMGAGAGKGADEIVEEVLRLFSPLTDSAYALQGYVELAQPVRPLRSSDNSIVVAELQFVALDVRSTRYYHTGRQFLATPGAGGSKQVTLTWALPPNRFDRVGGYLIRKAGASAPTTILDGTDLGIAALATSYVDTTPTADVYSYTYFVGYDELNTPAATPNRYTSMSLSVTSP